VKVRDIEIMKCIGEAQKFRIYFGKKDDGQQVILKVAKTFEDNHILGADAGEFNILKTFESQISSLQEKEGHENSHYDWLFADILASFMEPTQNDRRINVFTIPEIELGKLMPVARLQAGTEIDARTSVWILGRFFKFYGFFELLAESEDSSVVKYPLFSPDDYFIGPEQHRLIYYNFSGEIKDVIASDFVRAIAKFILSWVVIDESSEEEKEYLELLEDFSENGRRSFGVAHSDLYGLIEDLWGFHYHPFTYRDRNTVAWKSIKEE